MIDREKLRELIANVQDEGVSYVDCFSDTDKPEHISNDELARYLISRGVRLESKTSDKTSDSKWISVEERLPEDYEDVLTCDHKGNIHTMQHYHGFKAPFGIEKTDMRYYPVTHWMPLPQPPREE